MMFTIFKVCIKNSFVLDLFKILKRKISVDELLTMHLCQHVNLESSKRRHNTEEYTSESVTLYKPGHISSKIRIKNVAEKQNVKFNYL